MRTGAESALAAATTAPRTGDERPIRALPVEPQAETAREALVRRLAADRLRDLRDDGVTLGYVARMYGVEPALLEQVHQDLLALRTR